MCQLALSSFYDVSEKLKTDNKFFLIESLIYSNNNIFVLFYISLWRFIIFFDGFMEVLPSTKKG
jgi:hypothetical protein